MGLFTKFTNNKSYPDNRHLCIKLEKPREIVIGGTATHIFTLDFLYSQTCNRYEIFYKQGVDSPIIHIDSNDLGSPVPVEQDGKTNINIFLADGDTKLFNIKRSTFVQLKLHYKNGEIKYYKSDRIKLIDTLDA